MGAGQIELRDLGAQKDSKRRSGSDPRGSGRWTDAWRRWEASLGGLLSERRHGSTRWVVDWWLQDHRATAAAS